MRVFQMLHRDPQLKAERSCNARHEFGPSQEVKDMGQFVCQDMSTDLWGDGDIDVIWIGFLGL